MLNNLKAEKLKYEASLSMVDNIEKLLRKGANPLYFQELIDSNKGKVSINDIRDRNGNTILIKACQAGNSGVARVIIDAGCNVNVQNKDGNTALHYAKEKKLWSIC